MRFRNAVLTVCLLACLLAPGLLTYSWLQYRRTCLKKEAKQAILGGLPASQLSVFQWDIQSKLAKDIAAGQDEFEWHGQMFDVVSLGQHQDSLTVYCWLDEKESQLQQQWKNWACKAFQNDPATQHAQAQLLVFFQLLYCEPLPSWEAMAAVLTTTRPPLPLFLFTWASIGQEPTVPPPLCAA